MDVIPYLIFDGNAAEAVEFYAEVFGGEVEFVQTVAESPMANQMPAEAANLILHARVRIGTSRVMASDAIGMPYSRPEGISVNIGISDFDRAKRIFDRLAKGGETTMAFEATFWAKGFGSCRDRYGVPWMINCED